MPFSNPVVSIAGEVALAIAIAEQISAAGISLIAAPVALYAAAESPIPPGLSYVGVSVNGSTYGAGQTQLQAMTTIDGFLSRPMAVEIEKIYYSEGVWQLGLGIPPPSPEGVITAGGKVFISMKPNRTNSGAYADATVTNGGNTCAQEKANMAAAIALYPAGSIAGITLWQEANSQVAFPTAADYINYVTYYGPTVRAASIPLVYNTAGSYPGHAAAYYPGDALIDWVMHDFYSDVYLEKGFTLDTVAAIADGAIPPKPFGLGEFGVGQTIPTPADFDAYMDYVTGYFQGRINASKVNAPLIAFAQGNAPGGGNNGVVTGPTDYKVAPYQQIYDALSVIANSGSGPGTITVPPGGGVQYAPLNPSPGGGYAPVTGIGYELQMTLLCNAASANPFAEIVMTFYTADAPDAAVLDTVRWVVPMSASGAGMKISGTGPLKGAYVKVQANNLDTVNPVTTSLSLSQTSRSYTVHKWSENGSQSVPGFTRPNLTPKTLQLGSVTAKAIGVGATDTWLFPLWAGRMWFNMLEQNVAGGKIAVEVQPMPVSYFGPADNLDVFPGGATSPVQMELGWPRACMLVSVTNNGTVASDTSFTFTAIE